MTHRCFDQNRRDDTDSGCLPAVLWEVDIVEATIRRFGAIRALGLVGLLGIGLIASTAVPAVGSSNTWTPTGSMTKARTHHTATLLANGLVLTLSKNIRSDVPQTKVSMVVATPKPRLVKLAITPQGEDLFSIGGASRKATHYIVKVEIGGAAGLVAPLLGKQPPDTHVWILGGEAPAFVKSEGPLYFGGPIWRIELVSPVWPRALAVDSKDEPRTHAV
jgi:hypothetical protein